MTDYIYSIEAKNVNKTYKRKNLEVNALKEIGRASCRERV